MAEPTMVSVPRRAMVVFSFSLTAYILHGLVISTYNLACSLEVRTRTLKYSRGKKKGRSPDKDPGPPAPRAKGTRLRPAPFCSFGARRLRGGLVDRHGSRVRHLAVLQERERRGREVHVRDDPRPLIVRARWPPNQIRGGDGRYVVEGERAVARSRQWPGGATRGDSRVLTRGDVPRRVVALDGSGARTRDIELECRSSETCNLCITLQLRSDICTRRGTDEVPGLCHRRHGS